MYPSHRATMKKSKEEITLVSPLLFKRVIFGCYEGCGPTSF
jgi:hypothetical protein